MIRFTDNPLESLMQERILPAKPIGYEKPPENHPCHGCGSATKPCLLPCWKKNRKKDCENPKKVVR